MPYSFFIDHNIRDSQISESAILSALILDQEPPDVIRYFEAHSPAVWLYFLGCMFSCFSLLLSLDLLRGRGSVDVLVSRD